MVVRKPDGKTLRRMAIQCRGAAALTGDGGIVERFLALAADLDRLATDVERENGNGTPFRTTSNL